MRVVFSARVPKPLHLLRPVAGWLCLAIALQVVSAALVLVPLVGLTALARCLYDGGADAAPAAWHIIFASAACLGGGLALRGIAEVTTHLADNMLSLDLRRQLARRLAGAPLAWFTEHESGRIKQAMQEDVTAIHHLVAHAHLDLTNAVTTVLLVYVYLAWIDWHLTLVILLPLPIFGLLYDRVIRASSNEKMAVYGASLERVNQSVVEFVQGIPVVKSYGRQGQAHRAYREAIDSFQTFFLSWIGPLIKPDTQASLAIAPITLLLLVLCFGLLFERQGWIGAWQVIPFAVLGLGISIPIATLNAGTRSLQRARGALTRISELLAIPQQAAPLGWKRPAGTAVAFENVSFSFGDRRVLKDVSLVLPPGTVTALVGRSGSGKSTLAKLLLRLYEPDAGRITLGGEELGQIETQHLYQQVGCVLQDVRLMRMSLRDNIALGWPDAGDAEVEAAARTANIHDRILQLPRGYRSVYGEDVRLSGGEAQRVSIARALLIDPPVLVLDEATAQADSESEAAIQDALSTLIAEDESPRTVLVIAHKLDSIVNADAIVVMSEGAIVERGRHDELLALQGAYARLWRAYHARPATVART